MIVGIQILDYLDRVQDTDDRHERKMLAAIASARYDDWKVFPDTFSKPKDNVDQYAGVAGAENLEEDSFADEAEVAVDTIPQESEKEWFEKVIAQAAKMNSTLPAEPTPGDPAVYEDLEWL